MSTWSTSQKQTPQALTMADQGNDVKLPGSTTSTTKTPGGPIIKESQESEEYQRALQTVVGTALGVILLVGILALIFLLYRLRRQRRRGRTFNGSQQHSPIIQRSISVDVGSKPVPSVLVLYSYDCAMHEAVVVALSGLLMEICGVTVSLDVFEENLIVERGLEEWLEDRLQEVDFILVVCSLGARLRCSKKRVRFREEAGRLMPDYFAVAVDYVAEKLRVERSKGLGVNKFVTVVMDYSRHSDIPPQLEAAMSFILMRDFNALCQHLCMSSPNTQHKPPELGDEGGEGDAWQQTEAGAEMWAALGQARNYFKTHPNWVEDRLEPAPPRSRIKPRRRRRRHDQDAHDIPLLPMVPTDLSRHSMVEANTGDSTVIDMHIVPQRSGTGFAHSRQNSLPSSLCSSQPPASTCVQQSVSRSVDSFPPSQPLGREFGEGSVCLLCQQQKDGLVAGGRRVQCPIHTQDSVVRVPVSDTDGDSDLELGVEEADIDLRCSRSKSLPSVGLPPPSSISHLSPLTTSHTAVEGFTNTALSQSRTILHAEVHKEWGAPKEEDVVTDGENSKHTPLPHPSHRDTLRDTDLSRVPPAPKVWDLSKVSDAPKDWNSVIRPCGRVSPSSVSSDSSGSSFSGGHSGSDSLERDLRSITMPHIFDNKAGDALFNRLYGVAPPRSLSSSALVTGNDGIPVPFLTPLQPASHVEFTFDFSPIQWDGDRALEVPSIELEVESDAQVSHLPTACAQPGNSDS